LTGQPSLARPRGTGHPLSRTDENERLYQYEARVKGAFDRIVPTLKRISALKHAPDFVAEAQRIAREELGFELPERILEDAWVAELDLRRLFAWCVFETFHAFCDDFFGNAPLGRGREGEFSEFLQGCGFHTLDISPCADGRLAHVISYVLRLPYKAVRRKSYAGAMFDVEDSVQKWVETEMLRYSEGRPNTADAPTRYLKTVVYHYSSSDPEHEGCAAHGSDAGRAAEAALQRLLAFQTAVQNSFCCGASIDLLLIGLDTDTDAIRVHVPDAAGALALDRCVEAQALYEATADMDAAAAEAYVTDQVAAQAGAEPGTGALRLVTRLLVNNLSQIDYVRRYQGGRYADIGHAERVIGVGIGFEEVQLRNLTYFAYLDTVEEGAPDLDVGVKIFSGLNVGHGLPVPIIVRYDYQGRVPGARERSIAHCLRVQQAIESRFAELVDKGLLHTQLMIRDCSAQDSVEIVGSSVTRGLAQEMH
jgi:carboxysome shell carbonic anhydrase